jgi:hypothetical protein
LRCVPSHSTCGSPPNPLVDPGARPGQDAQAEGVRTAAGCAEPAPRRVRAAVVAQAARVRVKDVAGADDTDTGARPFSGPLIGLRRALAGSSPPAQARPISTRLAGDNHGSRGGPSVMPQHRTRHPIQHPVRIRPTTRTDRKQPVTVPEWELWVVARLDRLRTVTPCDATSYGAQTAVMRTERSPRRKRHPRAAGAPGHGLRAFGRPGAGSGAGPAQHRGGRGRASRCGVAALGVIGPEGKRLPSSTRSACPRSRSPGSACIRRATASNLEKSPVAGDEPGAGCAGRRPWCEGSGDHGFQRWTVPW